MVIGNSIKVMVSNAISERLHTHLVDITIDETSAFRSFVLFNLRVSVANSVVWA